jgi:hypothetical protein
MSAMFAMTAISLRTGFTGIESRTSEIAAGNNIRKMMVST